MDSGKKGFGLGEIALFAATAVVFFRVSLFLPIFVIPLTVLYRRRGFVAGSVGAAAAFGGIAGIKLYEILSRDGGSLRLDLIGLDFTMPLTFILGLALVELPGMARFRLHRRFVAATLLAAVLSVPLLRFVMVSPEFDQMLRAQVGAMFRSLTEGGSGSPAPFSGTEQVVRLSRYWFLNTFAAGYFVTFAANWVLGARIARRTCGEPGEFPAFTRFRVDDRAVWPFLLGWSAVFASLMVDLGLFRALAWNFALILTVLYGCQGVGIIKTLTAGASRGTRVLVTTLLIMLVFVPGINILVLAGVPLLGVSELWIHYRNKERR